MGSVGSKDLINFTQELTQLEYPAHILIAVGRSHNLIDKIESIDLPEHITTTVIPFTDKIADLMAVSDLLITKSGSVTFAESIYLQLPTILDATRSVLMWERLNHDIVKNSNIGTTIESLNDIVPLVSQILDESENSIFRKNMHSMITKNPCREICDLIKEIIKK